MRIKAPVRIITGVSAGGKGTLRKAIAARRHDLFSVVSYTTRPPREGEANGVDYWFVDRGEFLEMAERGDFLEYKNVFGNLYGTPMSSVVEATAQDKTILLEIDVQGCEEVLGKLEDVKAVFISCTAEEQRSRFIARADTPEDVIEQRLSEADGEYDRAHRLEQTDKERFAIIYNPDGKLDETLRAVEQYLF